MSLQNLSAIGRLQAQTPDGPAILKLLQAARRNIADAAMPQVSPDNRFDAAYKCIMQCAMLGLRASGYRTVTSQPGHHQTAIQCLPLTLAVPQADVIVLDALRKQRNAGDYEGDPVSSAMLASCVREARKLLAHTEAWLARQHPEWMEGAA